MTAFTGVLRFQPLTEVVMVIVIGHSFMVHKRKTTNFAPNYPFPAKIFNFVASKSLFSWKKSNTCNNVSPISWRTPTSTDNRRSYTNPSPIPCSKAANASAPCSASWPTSCLTATKTKPSGPPWPWRPSTTSRSSTTTSWTRPRCAAAWRRCTRNGTPTSPSSPATPCWPKPSNMR